MNRLQKEQVVKEIKGILLENDVLILVHYAGLTVESISKFRNDARKNGVGVKVVKNTLMRIAVEGTSFAPVVDKFLGQTAIVFSKDVVAAAKVVTSFAKDNENLEIIVGAMNGEVVEVDQVNQLSKLPSLDELKSQLISIIKAPATKIAGVLQAPAGDLARVFNAYSEKSE